NALLDSLGDDVIVATVFDPSLDRLEFFNFIAHAFNMSDKFNSKADFLILFSKFLFKNHALHKHVVLIIDEAQRLTNELLEEIRLLSNIEKQDTKLLTIFFVGQTEFNNVILKVENRALRQRITLNYTLDPLTEEEIGQYIRYRLWRAGSVEKIFTPGAIRAIFAFSAGYPRLINIICDHALLTGYVQGKKTINEAIVKECAEDLVIKPQGLPNEAFPRGFAVQTGSKPWLRVTGYIALIALLVIIAGYLKSDVPVHNEPAYKIGGPRIPDAPAPVDTNPKRENLISQPLEIASAAESKALSPEPAKDDDSPAKRLDHDAPGQNSPSGRANQPAPFDKSNAQEQQLIEDVDLRSLLDQKLIIRFQHNSNDLSEAGLETLEHVAAFMLRNPAAQMIIRGYTDSLGAYNYNVNLSAFRANIVKSYFVGKGISPSKMQTYGMGPEDPIASNDDFAGRNANRRVEIELVLNQTR
ncbi:MAG: OmpA family protein, partial [Desulfobacterales bacterium]